VKCLLLKFSHVQKPIRKGIVGPTLMVEELGRRKVNDGVKLLHTNLFAFTKLNSLYVHFDGNELGTISFDLSVHFHFISFLNLIEAKYFFCLLSQDLYVLRFYNRLDEARKGEVSCSFEVLILINFLQWLKVHCHAACFLTANAAYEEFMIDQLVTCYTLLNIKQKHRVLL